MVSKPFRSACRRGGSRDSARFQHMSLMNCLEPKCARFINERRVAIYLTWQRPSRKPMSSQIVLLKLFSLIWSMAGIESHEPYTNKTFKGNLLTRCSQQTLAHCWQTV